MILYTAYNIVGNTVYQALVLKRSGNTVYKETRAVNALNKDGRYWEHLRLLMRAQYVLDNVIQEPKELVTVVLNTSVMLKWFDKGRAPKEYKAVFASLYDNLRDCKYELELICNRSGNVATAFANEKYVKAEPLSSVADFMKERG